MATKKSVGKTVKKSVKKAVNKIKKAVKRITKTTRKPAKSARKTARKTAKSARKTTKSSSKKATKVSGRRELIAPRGDKRYVRRSKQGQFKESDDQGASLASDVRTKARTTVPSGQGDRGDQKQ